jgi:hypothetical protein
MKRQIAQLLADSIHCKDCPIKKTCYNEYSQKSCCDTLEASSIPLAELLELVELNVSCAECPANSECEEECQVSFEAFLRKENLL